MPKAAPDLTKDPFDTVLAIRQLAAQLQALEQRVAALEQPPKPPRGRKTKTTS